MNTMKTIFLSVAVALLFANASAEERENGAKDSSRPNSAASANPDQNAEEKFKALLTQAVLTGRWAPLKDGELGEERPGDKYNIVSVSKAGGDNWVVSAKMKYGDKEFVLPIPVKVKFVGDAAILVVDKLSIPGGGTYSARVMFYEKTYSGTWSSERSGGMIYGVISSQNASN